MRRRSITGLALLSLLAGASAAWWGLPARREGAAPPRPARTEDLPPIHAGLVPTAPPLATKGRCTIEALVRRDGEPAEALVQVWHIDGGPTVGNEPSPEEPELVPAWTRASSEVHTRAQRGGHATWSDLAVGRWLVEATAPGLRAGRIAELTVDGEQADLLLDLRPASLGLQVRILHADGSPFSGPVVLRALDRPELARQARADAGGDLRAEGLARGRYEVRLVDGPLLWTLGPVEAGLPTERVLRIPGNLRPIRGRVTAASTGRPIQGALVLAAEDASEATPEVDSAFEDRSRPLDLRRPVRGSGSWDARAELRDLRTDGTGSFRVVLPSSVTGLRAFADGFEPRTVATTDATPDLALLRRVPACRVHGRVVDAAKGDPIAGVSICTSARAGWEEVQEELDLGLRELDAGRIAVTDADGRYTGLVPGGTEVVLLAYGSGWILANLDAIRSPSNPFVVLGEPGGDLEVNRTVVRGAEVEGSVADAEGRPVAGAVVRAYGVGASERSSGEANGDPRLWDEALCEPTTTDAHGEFVLTGLLAGRAFRLWARRDGVDSDASERVVPPTESTEPCEVAFPRRRSVLVHVTYEEGGEPAADASVRVEGQYGRTDVDGDCRLALPDEDAHSIEVARDGMFATADLAARSADVRGAGASRVDVRIPGTPLPPLSGRVRFADGAPAPYAEIRIGYVVGVDVATHGLDTTWAGGSCDADGRFQLYGVSTGPHQLYATARNQGARGQRIVDREREGIEVLLDEGGATPAPSHTPALRLRILQPDGRPVPRARAALATLVPPRFGANVLRFGVRELPTGVVAGDLVVSGPRESDRSGESISPDRDMPRYFEDWPFMLRVWDARDEAGKPLPLGDLQWEGERPASTEALEIRMKPERLIEGTVLDERGLGVGGILVRAKDVAASEVEQPSFGEKPEPPWARSDPISSTRTDATGRFRLAGLGDHDYSVVATPPVGFEAPKPRTVPSGVSGLELRLAPRR